MDYRYLAAFSSAARHLSFAKAARELRVSPSAITRQIALLEKSVEGELFVRGNKCVLLTQLGVRLAASISQFESRTQSLKAESEVKIGCLQSVFELSVIDTICKHPQAFSGPILIELDSPKRLLDKLESGELDVIITNLLPAGTSMFWSMKLFQEEIDWIGKQKRLIIFSAFEDMYEEDLRHSKDRIRTNSFHVALALARRGLGRSLFAKPSKKPDQVPSKRKQWIYAVTPNYASPPAALTRILRALKTK